MLRRFVPLRLVAVAHSFRTSTTGTSMKTHQDTFRKYLEKQIGVELTSVTLAACENYMSIHGLTAPPSSKSWVSEALRAAWKEESIEPFVNSVEQLKLAPIELICNRAEGLFGGLTFIHTGELDRIKRRHLFPTKDKYYVESFLTEDLKRLVETDTTAVIGGASGSGKTVAMLRMGSKGPGADCAVIVVYGTPDEELHTKEELRVLPLEKRSAVNKAPPTATSPDMQGGTVSASSEEDEPPKETTFKNRLKALDNKMKKEDRNETMLEILDDFVISHIDSDTLGNIRALYAGRLTLVLTLDEMGEYPAAVRAMCALTSAEVKEKLGFAKTHPVEFRLVVGGTGVGQAGSPAGSSSSNFENLYATDDPSNDEIFADHALRGLFDIVKVREVLKLIQNKVPREVIASNSRMAAAYGDAVYRTLSQVQVADRYTYLAKMDLLAYLTPVAFEYKRLNRLKGLSLDAMDGLAIRSVRMNMFPTAPTFEKRYMQSKYGLVVDTSRYTKDRAQKGEIDMGLCGPSDTRRKLISGYSQYEVPAFTVATVAAMTNLSCVTKSLINGRSLEAYWHGASYLLACASASDKLLLKLFQDAHARKGSVKPLNYTSVKSTDGKVVVRDPLKVLSLPTKETVVVSTEADFSHWQRPDYVTFLKAVQQVFKKQKAKMMESYVSGVRICPIVSIRSPDKFNFADSITLIDNSLFLFQMKDMHRFISQEDVDEELLKMGDAKAMARVKNSEMKKKKRMGAFEMKKKMRVHAAATSLVSTIQSSWSKILVDSGTVDAGTVDAKVHRCFVTSSPALTKPKERKGKEREFGDSLLLNVESIKFLKFDNTRQDPEEQNIVAVS